MCVWSEPTDGESTVSDDRYGKSDTITFVATVTIKPEREKEYLAFMAAVENTILANEPDTLLHVMLAHPTEPHTYVFIERYRNAAALNAHLEAPDHREATEELDDFLAKPYEVLQLRQIAPS
jgi:quinol monooxygenase YgiN